ncbi:Holliday junction branch migration protein RuvA [Phytomonospora endophytica]|uniref:Holliday junction branch migration complex subunit RuvA n=1 Tax=Phytomonospora endophytica TaxID=714109 RepID=A0A841FGN9_9ACTN|nr:Holliday junction branch migration protein RuvA [Phytomonospora endophytica]MBB6032722.1 Holliday junction DNA helicase RuvA [Phytomonospora endophytica]GIG66129.1 Holliday junction ATP-dependent DNA helicase RuvA [Phytomonospora endophytica]
MIASVRGQVLALAPDAAVVDVGGVGYSVRATPGTLAGLAVGTESTLHTSLVVREDSLTLYGFADADERDLFELLQTASGVGPRLAQAALAVHPPNAVRRAIATGDSRTLTQIPGVGKKGAERLILELKDRIGPIADTGTAPTAREVRPQWREQVQQGLIALGWTQKDAASAITRLADTVGTAEGERPDVPSLLKQAIRMLGKTR